MLFVSKYSFNFNKKTKIAIQIHYTTILVCINKNLNEIIGLFVNLNVLIHSSNQFQCIVNI